MLGVYNDFFSLGMTFDFSSTLDMVHVSTQLAVDKWMPGKTFVFRTGVEIVESATMFKLSPEHIEYKTVVPFALLKYSVLVVHVDKVFDELTTFGRI